MIPHSTAPLIQRQTPVTGIRKRLVRQPTRVTKMIHNGTRDMVAYADKMVGQIVNQLEKSGVRENTVLIFTAITELTNPL